MNFSRSIGLVLCLVGVSLGMSANRYRGTCKDKSQSVGSSYTCTKYGFYEVKQCNDPLSNTCHCVDSSDGTVVAKVDKSEDCPPCLLRNAEAQKMVAEGYMDIDFYTCSDDGYFNDEVVQCSWYACFCYTKDGEVSHMLTVEEMSQGTAFSCKSISRTSETTTTDTSIAGTDE